MRSLWILAALSLVGCSDRTLDKTLPIASSELPGQAYVAASGAGTSKEAIPAEWTIAEDTSATGEITVESLQLPAAREIQGLSAESNTRLVLRCLNGHVTAFISPDSEEDESAGESLGTAAVQVQLDSAPACE